MQSKDEIGFRLKNWSPSIGCAWASAGCDRCYARAMAERFRQEGRAGYELGFSYREIFERLSIPLKTKKASIFFLSAMSDIFYEGASLGFLEAVLEVIKKTPQHQYQLLTKRPLRMAEFFATRQVPKNLWLGVSVEDMNASWRVDVLRQIDCGLRWINCEPLIGSLANINLDKISWVRAGGENGALARVCEPFWISELALACEKKRVAFYFAGFGSAVKGAGELALLKSKLEFRHFQIQKATKSPTRQEYPHFCDPTSLFGDFSHF